MQIERSEVGRKSYLDGLRGVAACIVFFDHLTLALFPDVITFGTSQLNFELQRKIGILPFGWLWNGSFAVCIFFVLSGYVLSEFCSRTHIGFIAQVARRYVRLALPMLFTSMFAFVIMALGLYKNLDAGLLITKSSWLIMWYRAFEPSFLGVLRESLLDAFLYGRANYNSNLWTMQIELLGSIAVFLIFLVFKSSNRRAGAAIALMIITCRSYYPLFAVGVFYYVNEARFGAFCRRVLQSRRAREYLALGVVIAGLYLGAFPNTPAGVPALWHWFLPRALPATAWHMAGASMVVGGLLFSPIVQAWLGGRFGRYLGRLSFVLYLVHLPIICSYTSWSVIGLSDLPYAANALLTAASTILLVFAVSTILYRYVDVYSTSLSRHVGQLVARWVELLDFYLRHRPLDEKVHSK